MPENSLIIFTQANRMLAEANTIQKVKELKDLALTAKDWARRKDMGREAVQHAHSYAVQAEIRLGELLKETERNDGGRPSTDNLYHQGTGYPPTLPDLGITRKESSKAQQLASLPTEMQQAIIAGEMKRTEAARLKRREDMKRETQAFPADKYRILYADPPWKYGDQLTENYGPTRYHYPSMTISELCALPIRDLTDENAVLFLWVTSPILPEAFDVVRTWGFLYKASFVWDKIKHNMGHYNSVRHEFLLVCTKGSCLPDNNKLHDSVISIERTEHSKKPSEFRELIDQMYTHGKRLELFARGDCPESWHRWGNE
jgi:N6-adenosine-specific RNA methylase IME4